MKDDIPRKQKIYFKPTTSKKADKAWIIKTIIITFTMSGVFNILSSGIMNMVNIWVAILILLLIILCGIIFDIIGVAVTVADEGDFHAKATKKAKGAKTSLKLIKNSAKVANICADVIGDICGVLSGAISTMISLKISQTYGVSSNVQFIISALVASLTVSGKAAGKGLAKKYSTNIVHFVGKLLNK